MDKNEFVRKFERIHNKYSKSWKVAIVRVTFDGGYTDCMNYKIWGRRVILTSGFNLAIQENPKGTEFRTVVRLRKVKTVRKATVL